MAVKAPGTFDFCKDATGGKPLLQLFDDKCFKIASGSDTNGEFCLDDFAFPADGYEVLSREVGPAGHSGICGDTNTIFDNDIVITSPTVDLDETCTYARGVMIKIKYPLVDLNGEELQLVRQKARIKITSAEGDVCEYPLFNMFSIFNNPESLEPSDLINKIEIVNPSDEYTFKVEGIVIYTKAFNG